LPSRRRRRADSRRSGTECLQCQIHRDSLRGASGSQRAHRVRGSSPRESSSSNNRHSSSSHVGQAEGTRPQRRQSHLPHWPGPDLGHEEDILSHSRHHVRGELQQRSSQREQQALDPQLPRGPRAEAFGVYLRDLRHLPGSKIRRLRSVPEDQWFPRGREECDPRFWTILQESFYASYTHRGSQLSQHRMLQFTALRAAAAGEAILPFFDDQWGLVDLVTRRSRYVPDWVSVLCHCLHRR
jgi:hypothetical protein